MTSERPTAPPTHADEAAFQFALAVGRKDSALRRRGSSSSGLIFALALAEALPYTDPDADKPPTE